MLAGAAVCAALTAGCRHEDAPAPPPQLKRSGILVTRERPPELMRLCERASAQLAGLPCPSLVPKTGVVADANLSTVYVWPDRQLRVLSLNNGEIDGEHIHWIVGRGTAAAVERAFVSDEDNEVEGRPRLLGTRAVDGHEVQLYRFPSPPAGGLNGGHVAAFVSCGATTIVASIHGYANAYAAGAVAAGLAVDAGCRGGAD